MNVALAYLIMANVSGMTAAVFYGSDPDLVPTQAATKVLLTCVFWPLAILHWGASRLNAAQGLFAGAITYLCVGATVAMYNMDNPLGVFALVSCMIAVPGILICCEMAEE